MTETQYQVNFSPDGVVLASEYHDPATQAAIESGITNHEAAAAAFRSVVDTENLNSKYFEQFKGVNVYFSRRGLSFDPVRFVTQQTMDKAYAAAGEQIPEDVEGAQGRNVHRRSVVVENEHLQAIFGDNYLLGVALHEAAHSAGRKQRITTVREVNAMHIDGEPRKNIILGGIASSGLIKADLRRDTKNKPISDFWAESFADLTRVRGLRYLGHSNTMQGEPVTVDMQGVLVTVRPYGIDSEPFTTQKSMAIPAEFATCAKTSTEGKNLVGVAPPNLGAYALELLDARMPGLYEDMEAGTTDPSRMARAIYKIERVRPGLYRQLRELEYTERDFSRGLRIVLDALSSTPSAT